MTTLDRDGVSIYYEVAGDGDPILLSHGYSATSAMWAEQVAALKDRFTVITWDMRGHGRSDSPEDPSLYSEAHTVADMKALLDNLQFTSAVIGGLSLGGYMSLAFCLAHPQMTRALLLFDTGPGYKSDSARAQWNETAEQRAVRFEQQGLGSSSRSDEVRIARHRSANGLARAARGMLKQFDARVIESLPHIEVPTLVLVGDQDTAYHAATDYMARKIVRARRVVLADAGHASNIHQPAAFNAAVEEFLVQTFPRLGDHA
jgi:pimeloyl-ACP methyl ester carboxylesterase